MERLSLDTVSFMQRLRDFPVGLLVLLSLLAGVGFLALYSAGGGSTEPWALQHITRFGFFACIMVGLSLVDVRWWFRLAYPFYGVCIIMLVLVDIFGHIGMGAQRWLNLGFIRIQPSELMKLATILALARYFHFSTRDDVRRIFFLLPPTIMIALPVALVMFQPDLGTAIKILLIGGALYFLAGVPLWMFGAVAGLVGASLPIAWSFLHDYQKQRVLVFMNPESDPLGSGFHIMQSKIALGSGGFFGKGFLEGSQSRLNFLPEKETDFVFTLWAEEWGMAGSIVVMGLYACVFMYGFFLARSCRHPFGRFVCLGVTANLSFYVFINTAMVMGLIPVVGIPLPLISHGGTVMMTVLFSFGIALSCYLHRDTKLVGRL